jgi:beta-galactosidase
MRKLFVRALGLLAASQLAAAASDLRDNLNFNREWKFQLGDAPGAEAAGFDDAKWNAANLPHSFSMPYFAANDKFYVGYG